ncbi:uncharacterized protein LOC143043577 [Mytilus galloprovincialis]|uniref:uncharacterized protein LOC143043577 n=1 Tax=Mytilus galloprovincialis TaxID=29158 RepID=UPI003F7B3F4D
MTRDEWEEIEYQYRQNGLLGMKLMALYGWKKKNETVKLQELLHALNGIERPHYLCQIVREDTNLYGIAESRLQMSPPDKVLNELSRNLGNCVIQLGIELGINFSSIEESMYRFPKDMYGQIYDILKKWKRQRSISPTIHRLMMALQRVDSGGLSYLRVKYK